MEHLMQMRTRFQLDQSVIYKSKHGIHKGKVVGLHDDFIFIKDIQGYDTVIYRVKFEDIIGKV